MGFGCSNRQDESLGLYPLKGPVSEKGYQVILATTDLGKGSNRFAFVLISSQGFVRAMPVDVSIFELNAPLEIGTYEAYPVEWGVQNRIMYVTNVVFTSKGKWNATIEFEHNQSNQRAEVSFEVQEKPRSPMVGEVAPVVNSKTLDDVDDMSELSTGTISQPELYRHSIAKVLKSDRPSVITFSSPAFCRNEVCGPQVEVIAELYDYKKEEAFFIHSEVYDNPEEIQGNLEVARFSEALFEWGLSSLQWTFIVGCDGHVFNRFQGFVALGELTEALNDLIGKYESGTLCLS